MGLLDQLRGRPGRVSPEPIATAILTVLRRERAEWLRVKIDMEYDYPFADSRPRHLVAFAADDERVAAKLAPLAPVARAHASTVVWLWQELRDELALLDAPAAAHEPLDELVTTFLTACRDDQELRSPEHASARLAELVSAEKTLWGQLARVAPLVEQKLAREHDLAQAAFVAALHDGTTGTLERSERGAALVDGKDRQRSARQTIARGWWRELCRIDDRALRDRYQSKLEAIRGGSAREPVGGLGFDAGKLRDVDLACVESVVREMRRAGLRSFARELPPIPMTRLGEVVGEVVDDVLAQRATLAVAADAITGDLPVEALRRADAALDAVIDGLVATEPPELPVLSAVDRAEARRVATRDASTVRLDR